MIAAHKISWVLGVRLDLIQLRAPRSTSHVTTLPLNAMNVPDLSRTPILVRPLTPSNVFKSLGKQHRHTLISFLFFSLYGTTVVQLIYPVLRRAVWAYSTSFGTTPLLGLGRISASASFGRPKLSVSGPHPARVRRCFATLNRLCNLAHAIEHN